MCYVCNFLVQNLEELYSHDFLDGEIEEFPVNHIKPEDIVDTNGTGDAFVGGI